MTETLITLTEATKILGFANNNTTRSVLWQREIKPKSRQPGKNGESLYDLEEIKQTRPNTRP